MFVPTGSKSSPLSGWTSQGVIHNWKVGAGPHFGKQRVETCRTLSPRQKALQTPKHRGSLRLGVGGWGDKRGSGKEWTRHKYTCTTMRSRIPLFIRIKCADLKIDKSNSTWTCWYAAATPCPFLIRKAGVEKNKNGGGGTWAEEGRKDREVNNEKIKNDTKEERETILIFKAWFVETFLIKVHNILTQSPGRFRIFKKPLLSCRTVRVSR